MEELRALASTGLIADFVENPPFSLSTEYVSGVSLRIDEFWLYWERAYLWPQIGYPLPYHTPHPVPHRELRTFYGARHDFTPRPPTWSAYCRRKGYPIDDAHPVTVVAILRAPFDQKLLGDAPRAIGAHPIVYEYRPEAVGYALAPGDFIGCTGEGTLGGFLWNTSESSYQAMSCAHVLGESGRAYSPRPNVFGTRTEIGSVTFSLLPVASGMKCNRAIQPDAPVIDLALVTVDAGTATLLTIPDIGRVAADSAIANMDQNDPVWFFGQKSQGVQAKTAELNIWKELKINCTPTCFSDLFVIDHPSYPYIGTNLARPGDSGAWIVTQSMGTVTWDGMLIGGDGLRAYCCFAENIMKTLAKQPLTLPP